MLEYKKCEVKNVNYNDVLVKYKKKNKVLFSRESHCLQTLLEALRSKQQATIVLWALESCESIYHQLDDDPNDTIIQAIDLCWQWARGEIKMPQAKASILQVHGLAKQIDDPVKIAYYHAIGQGLSAIHVETHAIGLVMYELTAIIRKNGIDCVECLDQKIENYIQHLHQCEKNVNRYTWASFLLKDKPNKEQLLYQKKNNIS